MPTSLHAQLAREFAAELKSKGRIYGYRYRPAGAIRGKPIDQYKVALLCVCVCARATSVLSVED